MAIKDWIDAYSPKVNALAQVSAGNGVESGLAVTWISGLSVKVAAGVFRLSGARWSIPDTTLDSTMNGLTLPRSSLTVNATEGFLTAPTSSQPLIVTTSGGAQVVRFTSITNDTVFATNVADGTGTMSTGANVSQGLTVGVAHATLNRIDLVLVSNTGYISLLAGTAATLPIPPTVSAGSLAIAQIYVGANVSALTAAVLTDLRVLLPTLNTSLPYVLDNTSAMKQWRKALTTIAYKPVDLLWGPGDSINEGYYNSDDFHRHIHLTRMRLQQFYNPAGVPGGEGYVPFLHFKGGLATAAGTPTGSVNLPQRWTTSSSVVLPETYLGTGIGQRGGYLTAANDLGLLPFFGDRVWLLYTQGPGNHWVGWAIDASLFIVTTQGVLSGTGTGTFGVTFASGVIIPRLPTAAFTMTVEDEDMTCTVDRAGTTVTISARGVNSTVAVAHANLSNAYWAPAGVIRVNTNGTQKSGRIIDSGALPRDVHTITAMMINHPIAITSNSIANPTVVTTAVPHGLSSTNSVVISGVATSNPTINGTRVVTVTGASTFTVPVNVTTGGTGGSLLSGGLVGLDGAMIFDGDGGPGPASFVDGVSTNASTTYTSATAAFVSATHKGQPITGTNIPPNTTIASVTNATTIVLSQNATASGTALPFSFGGNGAGVRSWDGNRAGAYSSDYIGPVGTITGYWAEALDNVDPKLCVIEVGANDIATAATPEPVFKANLVLIIALIRAQARSNPSIVLQITYQPGFWTSAQWASFVNAIYGVALDQGCAVWDMTSAIPTSPATAVGVAGNDLFADTLHPTDLLSVDIAQRFAFLLNIPDMPANTLLRSFGLGGDGSDGSVIFDGTTTILTLAPSSSIYTLTRDLYVRDMTVNSGVTIKPVNFRIFAAGTITNNGTISNDGNAGGNAVTSTPGAAGTVTALQTLAATLAGGIGGAVNGAGAAGAAAVAADGPILGGNGGTGATAAQAGGAGGTTANTANINAARQLLALLEGTATSAASTGKILFIKGGQGGGGGGGQAATNAGGGGGAAGGVIIIVCQTLINNGTISAKGGVGGTAPGTAGGGGGGGGGVIIIITANPQRLTGTLAVEGGLPGLGGAGTPTAGARGQIIVPRL